MIDVAPMVGVTEAPLVPACGGTLRGALTALASRGLTGVQLSAAQRGLRPRELSHRERQDLARTVARHGLVLSGLDLMIPRAHWLSSERIDRAVTAATAAVELAGDLGRVPMSLLLPVGEVAEDVTDALLTAADARDVVLAIHDEADLATLRSWLDGVGQPIAGAGVDPATVLAEGGDPADAVVQLSDHLRVPRFDDYASPSVGTVGGRRVPGEGDLDVTAYRAALAGTARLRSVAMELRELSDPLGAIGPMVEAWRSAAPL